MMPGPISAHQHIFIVAPSYPAFPKVPLYFIEYIPTISPCPIPHRTHCLGPPPRDGFPSVATHRTSPPIPRPPLPPNAPYFFMTIRSFSPTLWIFIFPKKILAIAPFLVPPLYALRPRPPPPGHRPLSSAPRSRHNHQIEFLFQLGSPFITC